MKVLINCHIPFSLAHGGMQLQIEHTKAALGEIGVETDYLQWWNDQQKADILHHFGWLPSSLVAFAHNKRWKVVCTILLTATCNRHRTALRARGLWIRTALALPLPQAVKSLLPWLSYRLCDRMVVGLRAEAAVLTLAYGVARRNISVVPLGMMPPFLRAGAASRTADHLICTGTITPVKNSVELARLARAAQTPILFVGKPHDAGSDYWRAFQGLVDNRWVKHHPHVRTEPELIELLQRARGFVLMSRHENWSLAAHEAAACGLPLLVPDQPWSRECFGDQVCYFPKRNGGAAVAALRAFYDRCPSMSAPKIRFYTWQEVAHQLRVVYEEVLSTPA